MNIVSIPTQADYVQLFADLALYKQQNIIISQRAEDEHNRLWKLETLLAVCGMMVEHDEAGWYINYARGTRLYRPLTMIVDTFEVVEEEE